MAIYNWYHGKPTDSNPASDPDPTPAPSPTVTLTDAELHRRYLEQFESGRPDGRPDDIAKFGKGTLNPDGSYTRSFTVVTDLSNVKYESLNDYLSAEKLGDRSGFFSGVDFGVPFDSTTARVTEGVTAVAGPQSFYVFSGRRTGCSRPYRIR